jgi:anionic cell wall polymer biosynthesis LytR-Cps2A-Psr (LCP) family protein
MKLVQMILTGVLFLLIVITLLAVADMFTFLSRNIKRFSTKLNSLNKFTDEEEMIREAGNK